MEIERLTAEVSADASKAVAELTVVDKKADDVAEDRHGTITLNTVGGDGKAIGDGKSFFGIFDKIGDFFKNILGGGGGAGRSVGAAVNNLGDLGSAITDVGENASEATGNTTKFFDSTTKSILKAGAVAELFKGGMEGVFSVFQGGVQLVSTVQTMLMMATALTTAAGAAIALTAALAPLTGLLAVLPGMFAAVGAIALAVLPAMMSFMKGFQGLSQAQEQGVQSANNLAAAEHALAMAQREAGDAAIALAKARHEASEAIEDAQFAAEEAELSEARAILNLKKAYENLRKVQQGVTDETDNVTEAVDFYTGKTFRVARITADAADQQMTLQEALLAVKEAELAVAKAKDHTQDTQDDLNEKLAKGIENSDIMVAAQRRMADAAYAVAQAQQGLAQANVDVGKTGMDAFNKLSPAAKRVAQLIMSLKGWWEDLVLATQEELFTGIEAGIKAAMPAFDELKDGAVLIAGSIGDAIAQVGELLGSPEMQADIETFFGGLDEHIRNITPGVLAIMQGLTDIMIAAKPLADFLSLLFTDVAQGFADWAEQGRESGSFAAFFQETIEVIQTLMDIFGNLFVAFGNILEAAKPLGDWLLGEFAAGAQEFRDWTDSAEGADKMSQFFENIKAPLEAIFDFVRQLVPFWMETFGSKEAQDSLAQLIQFFTDLLPIAQQVIEMIMGLDFTGVLSAMLPFIQDIVDLFESDAYPAIKEFVDILADPATWAKVEEILMPFLEKFFDIISGIFNFLNDHEDLIPWLIAGLIAFAGALAAIIAVAGVVGVIMLITAAIGGIGWVIIGVIVAIAALAYVIWKNWDTIKGWLSDAWEWIKDKWEAFTTWVTEKWDWLWGEVEERWESFKGWIEEQWNNFTEWAEGLWDGFWDAIIEPIEDFVGMLRSAWDEAWSAGETAINTIEGIWDGFTEWLGNTLSEIGGFFDGLWQEIVDIWDNIWAHVDAVVGWIGDRIDDIGGFFEGLWDGFTEGLYTAIDIIIGGFEWLINAAIDGLNAVSGPFRWLAEQVGWDIGEISPVHLGRINEAQHGGTKLRGWTLLGENGPELVWSGNNPISVISNNETMTMLRNSAASGGVGLSRSDMHYLVRTISEMMKPNVDIEQVFHTDVDPKAISSDLAWRIAS